MTSDILALTPFLRSFVEAPAPDLVLGGLVAVVATIHAGAYLLEVEHREPVVIGLWTLLLGVHSLGGVRLLAGEMNVHDPMDSTLLFLAGIAPFTATSWLVVGVAMTVWLQLFSVVGNAVLDRLGVGP